MKIDIRHESESHRFVASVEGRAEGHAEGRAEGRAEAQGGYLRYAPDGDKLDLLTTFVDPELRGRGVGEKLVKAALDHAREEGCEVIPSCWFVETVIERNPGYRDLLVGRAVRGGGAGPGDPAELWSDGPARPHGGTERGGTERPTLDRSGAPLSILDDPPAGGTAQATATPRNSGGGGGRSRRVLVVDDDAAVLDVACKVLKRAGYEVLAATGGEEALRVAREEGESIDLLLTDVVMPGMNGRELAERLRAERPDLPVLYMSGYTEDQVILQGVRVAEVDFVAKPFTLEGLLDAVEEILEEP